MVKTATISDLEIELKNHYGFTDKDIKHMHINAEKILNQVLIYAGINNKDYSKVAGVMQEVYDTYFNDVADICYATKKCYNKTGKKYFGPMEVIDDSTAFSRAEYQLEGVCPSPKECVKTILKNIQNDDIN